MARKIYFILDFLAHHQSSTFRKKFASLIYCQQIYYLFYYLLFIIYYLLFIIIFLKLCRLNK